MAHDWLKGVFYVYAGFHATVYGADIDSCMEPCIDIKYSF
jgi:hypothetical protein